MDSDKKKKQKSKPTPIQAAEFLRDLACQLEDGKGSQFGQELSYTGAIKLEQSLKSKTDKTTLSIELKIEAEPLAAPELNIMAPEDEPPAAEATKDEAEDEADSKTTEGKPLSYKKLKKLLAEEEKTVAKPLGAGKMPAPDLVQVFIRDFRLLAAYPGKGDPNFPQVIQLADELAAAGEARNQEQMSEVMVKIKSLKKNCHDKFK